MSRAEVRGTPIPHREIGSARRIVVVGGYGAVGRPLCRRLVRSAGVELVVAGRRLEAAQAFAGTIGASALRTDVSDPATWGGLVGADAVVMCIDQQEVALADGVLSAGGAYFDLTADDGFFRRLEGLPPRAGHAVLCLGLAPGLTNLLATAAAATLDVTAQIRIGLLFGLGDSHGVAGLDWTVAQVLAAGRTQPFVMDFGPPWRRRRVYPVDFADQFALRRTLEVSHVATGLCFDSRLVTGLAFELAAGASSSDRARRWVRALASAIRFGSRDCQVSVHAAGERDGRRADAWVRFAGREESSTTAAIAAAMIVRCLDRPPPPGVWHSHQVLDPAGVVEELAREGVGRFTAGGAAAEGLVRVHKETFRHVQPA